MGSVKEEEFMQAAGVPGEKIFVSVRVRPLNEKENSRNDVSDWECINENTIIYRNNLSASEKSMYPTAYTFDRVFGVDCNTRRVYEEGAKHVALSVVSGINSSIFAYGQTSSGKTYTMSGITEHTVADIFDYLQKHKEREFTLKLSALEIYNESVRDLLTSDTTPLRLLDDPERGTVVERLTEATLRDWSHFKDLLAVCETQRQIGETTMNEASSRSHQIIRLTIESSALEFSGNGNSSSLTATVNFVDLAGSERASQALSAGTRLKEGCHINRSLLTLGTVIRKLSKGRNGHVPFRDSKLTRILQSSLGGNARTAIICTMSPARSHVEQSRNTLLFASCAKEVSTNAQVNVVMSDKALVKQLQREVARLKDDLRSSGSATVIPDSEALLKEKDLQIEKLKKEVADLTMQLEFAQSHIRDLLEVVKEEQPSIASPDRLYPKLIVRNAWDSENQSSSPISSAPYCAESVRSFGASHYSAGHSRRSSDAYLIEPSDYEENLRGSSSPRILVKVTDHDVASDAETNVESEVHMDKIEEKKEVDVCESCGDIRSVEEKKLCTIADSNTLGINPNTYAESNMSSPVATTEKSGLTVVGTRYKENQYEGSPHFEASKQENSFFKVYVVSSPERASSGHTQSNICSTRSPIITKSKSCKASFMMNISPNWFPDEENMVRTPSIFEKESTWKYEFPSIEVLPLKYKNGRERLSRGSSQNSLRCTTVYQDKVQNGETLADRTVTESNRKVDLDSEDRREGGLKPELCSKLVRDVGVDPIEWHGENSPDWPSEFRRLRREIIELWHACNVSLIHRTYFFLLFNGDPSDSIYMEVELRRLSYLKQTSSDSSQPVEDGGHDTPASSIRNLRRERQMLSKQMQKKLSEAEREALYIKWGIALNGKHRRLQLAHKLWSNAANMEHIRDSANFVAKLVGHVEPEQAFKEMFGLNFAPRLIRRKSFVWPGSMKNLLQTSV